LYSGPTVNLFTAIESALRRNGCLRPAGWASPTEHPYSMSREKGFTRHAVGF
jgi:hypothetical protein